MLNALALKFIDTFQSANAIEIDDQFIRHYSNEVNSVSGNDPTATVIDLSVHDDDGDVVTWININAGDLEDIELDEEGTTWSVGSYDITFYNVSPGATNPVIE